MTDGFREIARYASAGAHILDSQVPEEVEDLEEQAARMRARLYEVKDHKYQSVRRSGDSVVLEPPLFCDYGFNVELGERVFFNFNCVILDVCPVRIGSSTLFGPAVQILTPMHPLNAEQRRGKEFGKPIEIGSDVWVGGGALILPGVASARGR